MPFTWNYSLEMKSKSECWCRICSEDVADSSNLWQYLKHLCLITFFQIIFSLAFEITKVSSLWLGEWGQELFSLQPGKSWKSLETMGPEDAARKAGVGRCLGWVLWEGLGELGRWHSVPEQPEPCVRCCGPGLPSLFCPWPYAPSVTVTVLCDSQWSGSQTLESDKTRCAICSWRALARLHCLSLFFCIPRNLPFLSAEYSKV